MEKRRGRPSEYGKRKTHAIRVPDLAWEGAQSIAKLHGCQGVAELIIKIGTGRLAVFAPPQKNFDNVLDD